jgi:hypothetical protein
MAARLSSDAKKAAVARFDELTSNRVSVYDAARQIGQSTTSLYRWKKNLLALKAKNRSARSGAMTIDEALEVLLGRHGGAYAKHEALFKLLAWMRWPWVLGDHPAVMTSCVAAYVAQSSSRQTAKELDRAMQDLLLRSLRLEEFAWLCTADFINRPEFASVDAHDPRTGYSLLSDAVWFLLAHKSSTGKTRQAPSLRKAAFLYENDAFGTGAWAANSFHEYWRGYGAAIPFWFVARESSSFDLGAVQPRSKTFAADIDRLVAQEEALAIFLAKCRWVTECLEKRLDGRALRKLGFPCFPSALKPIEFPLRRLPAAVETVLKDY